MPTVLVQPRLLNPAICPLRPSTSVALVTLTGLLFAPPDQPNLPILLSNVLRGLDALFRIQPQLAGSLEQWRKALSAAVLALQGNVPLLQPAGMVGRVGSHCQWALLAQPIDHAPEELFQLIGVETARAYLTRTCFSAALARQLQPVARKAACERLNQGERDWLVKAVLHHVTRARLVFNDRANGVAAQTASFNARVASSLSAQTSSLRTEERQAAGRLNEMSAPELRASLAELRVRVETDDSEALQIVLAFCFGLPFEVSASVPFLTSATSSTVAWINPIEGCIYVDLERVFPGLAKNGSDCHVQTTLLLARPLPNFVADKLHRTYASNPDLTVTGDLSQGRVGSSRTAVSPNHNSPAIRASVARLIASRSAAALRAGLARDSAAYATLSLSLVSKSDHHYLIKNRADIWQACENLYQHLGFGRAVSDPQICSPAFGSRLTPQAEWVTRLIAQQAKNAIATRPGKRYLLSSLVAHHNAFACHVATVLLILIGARNRKALKFCASIWNERHAFGQHGDKRTGPTKGLTPLPIPVTLSCQIEFWKIHLDALDRRFDKLSIHAEHPTRTHIRSVLSSGRVDLIFLLDDEGSVKELASNQVFVGAAEELTRDFSRHFLPGLLTDLGVPFEYVQSWLRHHVDGIAGSRMTSTTVERVWLSCVASTLDRVALNLGLRPIHGIAREWP